MNAMPLDPPVDPVLAPPAAAMPPSFALALASSFGSVERWRDEFAAMGKIRGGDAGWLLLCLQPHEGRLVNRRSADPGQAAAGGVPLLALDTGAAAGAHVNAFMAGIAWDQVHARYRQAVAAASEALAADARDLAPCQLLDVRRAAAIEQAGAMLPRARWRERRDGWWARMRERVSRTPSIQE